MGELASETTRCSACQALVPTTTIELSASGAALCHACALKAQIAGHEQAHRSRRGLLLPSLFGLICGLILGLHWGGDDPLTLGLALGGGGAVAGAVVRLLFRAAGERFGRSPGFYWLAALVYAGVVFAVSFRVYSRGLGFLLAVPALLAAGLFPQTTAEDPNTVERVRLPASAVRSPVGAALGGLAQFVAAAPRTAILALCGFLALVPVIGAGFGIASGLQGVTSRARAASSDDLVDLPTITPMLRPTPPVEARACPEESARECPHGTSRVERPMPMRTIETLCQTAGGVAHGPASRSFHGGAPMSTGSYCDGEQHHVWISWRRDGGKLSEGRYERGRRVGRWWFWDDQLHRQGYQDHDEHGNVVGEGWTDDGAELLTGYRQGCEQRQGQACLFAGWLYEGEQDVPGDPAEARAHHRAGCRHGEARACTALARLLWTSEDEQENTASIGFMKKGCEGGDPEGCSLLGEAALWSEKPAEARAHYQRACEAGVALACANASSLLRDAEDLPDAERARAIEYAEKACRLGHAESCGP